MPSHHPDTPLSAFHITLLRSCNIRLRYRGSAMTFIYNSLDKAPRLGAWKRYKSLACLRDQVLESASAVRLQCLTCGSAAYSAP